MHCDSLRRCLVGGFELIGYGLSLSGFSFDAASGGFGWCRRFDPFSFHQDGLPRARSRHSARREVFQAFSLIALVVVVIDEPADAGFEIARQVIVFPTGRGSSRV